jgi:hypothetical protein
MEERIRDNVEILKKIRLKAAYLAKSCFQEHRLCLLSFFFFFVPKVLWRNKNKFKCFVKIFVLSKKKKKKKSIFFFFNYEMRASSFVRIRTCDRT